MDEIRSSRLLGLVTYYYTVSYLEAAGRSYSERADTTMPKSGSEHARHRLSRGTKHDRLLRAEAKSFRSQRAAQRPLGLATRSGRYTPPVTAQKVSRVWVPAVMFTLFGLAMVVVFLNYVGLLPGAPTVWYKLGSGVFLVGGLAAATQWR